VRFFRKLLKGLEYVPRVLITDKLGSYQAAQPTRQRERAMKRFTSARHAQRFLSAFSGISSHFRPRRHRLGAQEYRSEMATRFTIWNERRGWWPSAGCRGGHRPGPGGRG
jgi:putative transposase